MITPVPCLADNYAYLVTCDATGKRAVVDPSEAEPVLAALGGARLDAIWNTHHHWDHVGGNVALAKAFGCDVFGHASDRGRIDAQTRFLEEGDAFELGALRVRVLHIPGHTTGAIAYVVEGDGGSPAVFTGDTLFVAGCGRLFEGTPEMMFASFRKLAALPDETRVYCGHEYAASNLRFAAHVEPDNDDVRRAAAALRVPSVPSTIAAEKRINPFLRAPDAPTFAARRALKDRF